MVINDPMVSGGSGFTARIRAGKRLRTQKAPDLPANTVGPQIFPEATVAVLESQLFVPSLHGEEFNHFWIT